MATFHPYPLLLLYGQGSCDDTTAAASQKLFEKRPRLLCVTLIFALLETPASLNVKINSWKASEGNANILTMKRTSKSK